MLAEHLGKLHIIAIADLRGHFLALQITAIFQQSLGLAHAELQQIIREADTCLFLEPPAHIRSRHMGHQGQVAQDVDEARDQHRYERRAGIAHAAKQAGQHVVARDEQHAQRADGHVAHRLGEGLRGRVQQPAQRQQAQYSLPLRGILPSCRCFLPASASFL